MNKKDKVLLGDNKNMKRVWSLRELILAIILVWLTMGYILYFIPNHGVFGDMFGAVNALFSGLAFVALIYTIHLQTEEIKFQSKQLDIQNENLILQREELSLTRNEIKSQTDQLAIQTKQLSIQNDVLNTQNFENSFFQLLKLLSEMSQSITVTFSGTGSYEGKQAFERALKELKGLYLSEHRANLTEEQYIKKCCDVFFNKYQSAFGHYFRTLYNIIKLISRSSTKDKRFYTNLVRAQLSNAEVLVIFYDGISELGSEKFKPLIEKFSLLKVIKPQLLIDQSHHDLYSKQAYSLVKK